MPNPPSPNENAPDEPPNVGADDESAAAFAAYLKACDEGTVGSREEFLAQFPDIAEDLRSAMDAADALELFTGLASTVDTPAPSEPNAETVDIQVNDLSSGDPAATLPEANRRQGDPGPTLPYDLGDYELTEIIGRGGMGVVYRAKQRMLDRTVAVKMIRGGMLACENDVRRFYTEAQAAAGLHHPGIVPVYQFGHRAGHHFFSMALIEGTDLQKKINEDQMPIEDAARYVRDIARAIEHAHQNEVLHRDIKPANILIDSQNRVHITDFGLAKNLGSDSSVTGSGAAVGTPNYMAPEQAGGHSDRATRASDVYSLGAILFACVTGRPPLVGESVVETLLQVIHDPPPTMRSLRSGVPADLETIVAKCLEKQPKKRYESARAVADDLNAFLEGRPILARPRGRVVKVWHWMQGVPLVGALVGRKVVNATAGHRRFQAAMLLLVALTPFLVVLGAMLRNHHIQSLPDSITIAGGLQRGVYNEISEKLAKRISETHNTQATVISTGGSVENRELLLSKKVALALMQESAISGDKLCVVAPLIREAAHLLVRTSAEDASTPWSLDRLKDEPIAVGPAGSGSRRVAEMILDSLELDSTERVEIPWGHLEKDDAPSNALICVGTGSSLISELIEAGWRIQPIPRRERVCDEHPTLFRTEITAADYPSQTFPANGIETVGITGFLATRLDAPAALIEATLQALYEPALDLPGLIPIDTAAERKLFSFHPVARRYFSAVSEAKE